MLFVTDCKESSSRTFRAFSQYLSKASMASNGVIIGAKNSLLSNRAVCAQETLINTSHCHSIKLASATPPQCNSYEVYPRNNEVLPQENLQVLQGLVFP
ncbi:hypothetical protein ACJIZ3_015969 [Penstemon smallii]|uniref:Uncharacterized protein n=1 Tax=Penstemon smallii TaxID=265156 RepID=A0ABD3RRV7_9LAMI